MVDYKFGLNLVMMLLCILAVGSMWQLYEEVKENNMLLEACDIQQIVHAYCGTPVGGIIGGWNAT